MQPDMTKRKAWQRRDDYQPPSKEFRRNRPIVVRRDRGLCLICELLGRVTPARDCDHLLSRAQGGSDDISNLSMICPDCHAAKSIEERRANATEPDANLLPAAIGPDGYPLPTVTRHQVATEIAERNAALRADAGF